MTWVIWPWPWPNDLATQAWPRYGQDVPACQKWSFYVKGFKSYSLNRWKHRWTDRQTHRHDPKHYLPTHVGGNNNLLNNGHGLKNVTCKQGFSCRLNFLTNLRLLCNRSASASVCATVHYRLIPSDWPPSGGSRIQDFPRRDGVPTVLPKKKKPHEIEQNLFHGVLAQSLDLPVLSQSWKYRPSEEMGPLLYATHCTTGLELSALHLKQYCEVFLRSCGKVMFSANCTEPCPPPCRGPRPWPPPLSPPKNLFQLGPHCTRTPHHLQDTVGTRAFGILLECFLVLYLVGCRWDMEENHGSLTFNHPHYIAGRNAMKSGALSNFCSLDKATIYR